MKWAESFDDSLKLKPNLWGNRFFRSNSFRFWVILIKFSRKAFFKFGRIIIILSFRLRVKKAGVASKGLELVRVGLLSVLLHDLLIRYCAGCTIVKNDSHRDCCQKCKPNSNIIH